MLGLSNSLRAECQLLPQSRQWAPWLCSITFSFFPFPQMRSEFSQAAAVFLKLQWVPEWKQMRSRTTADPHRPGSKVRNKPQLLWATETGGLLFCLNWLLQHIWSPTSLCDILSRLLSSPHPTSLLSVQETHSSFYTQLRCHQIFSSFFPGISDHSRL